MWTNQVTLCFTLLAPYWVVDANFATTTSLSSSPSSNTFLICLEMVDLLRWSNSVLHMGPSQLSLRWGDNVLLRKSLRAADTMSQFFLTPSWPVSTYEPQWKTLYHLFSIFGSLVEKHILLNAFAYIPVGHAYLCVKEGGNPASCAINYLAYITI